MHKYSSYNKYLIKKIFDDSIKNIMIWRLKIFLVHYLTFILTYKPDYLINDL